MFKDLTKLGEVLEGYAAATPDGNDSAILRDWIRRHPEFADDLADFAASRTVVLYCVDVEPTPGEEERDRERAGQRLAAALSEMRRPNPIASLTGLAENKGLNKKAFADAAGLSLSLVMYLEKRRLEFGSIPRALIGRLATIIGTAEESVAAYLRQGPELAPDANFKASRMPSDVVQKNFADVVNEDQILSAEQKSELLKLANG